MRRTALLAAIIVAAFLCPAYGQTAPAYTWTSTGLPPGIVLTASSNGTSATFAGIPTTAGAYPVTVTACSIANPANCSTYSRTVTIVAPITISGSLPDGVVGVAYSATLTVSAAASTIVSTVVGAAAQ